MAHNISEIGDKSAFAQVENAGLDTKVGVSDYRSEAIAAEDAEHNMGVSHSQDQKMSQAEQTVMAAALL